MKIIKTSLVNKLCSILFILVLFGMSSIALSETYYVSPSGNDSNPGTLSQPWRTIGKANSTLRAGDTVYIREGTYSSSENKIQPSNTGSEGNYINYQNYGSEKVTLDGNSDTRMVEMSSKNYIKIDGISFTDTYDLELYNCDYCIIQNCDVKFAYNGFNNNSQGLQLYGNQDEEETGSDYNKILNCTFNESSVDPIGNLLTIEYGSSYNVVEGCTIKAAYHSALVLRWYAHHNVIRKNTFDNSVDRGFELEYYAERNLIEGNLDVSNGRNSVDQNQNQASGTEYNIIRKNVVFFPRCLGFEIYSASGGRARFSKIYNNNVANARGLSAGGYYWPRGFGSSEGQNNIYKNNIFFNNYGVEWSLRNISLSESMPLIKNNNFFHDSNLTPPCDNCDKSSADVKIHTGTEAGNYTIQEANTQLSTYFQGNIDADPLFKNADVNYDNIEILDFTLNSGSLCIDAGTHLTQVNNSGTGNILEVNDAGYFYDGWGIPDEEGDIIQVGSNEPVQVVNIDYDNNIITVAEPISWENGDIVSLAYTGSAPDIGAYEFEIASLLNASISLNDPSPTKEGTVEVTLISSKTVTAVPTPLIFTQSDNSTTNISLQGSVPGRTFTGIFIVDESVADGIGKFYLPENALEDEEGNFSNYILSGAEIKIDKTPPNKPIDFENK